MFETPPPFNPCLLFLELNFKGISPARQRAKGEEGGSRAPRALKITLREHILRDPCAFLLRPEIIRDRLGPSRFR